MSFGKTRGLVYHIVINPKYRKPTFANTDYAALLESIITSLIPKLDCSLITYAIQPDHVHLLIDIPTTRSVSDVMFRLKWWTSRRMRSVYPELKAQKALWSRRYFVRQVANSGDNKTVTKYINKQKWGSRGRHE